MPAVALDTCYLPAVLNISHFLVNIPQEEKKIRTVKNKSYIKTSQLET